jgi:hypothetical protein
LAHRLSFVAYPLFTEAYLRNPALGLASPERVLSSLGTAEGSPEPPVEGPITGPPLDVGDPSFGLSHAKGLLLSPQLSAMSLGVFHSHVDLRYVQF